MSSQSFQRPVSFYGPTVGSVTVKRKERGGEEVVVLGFIDLTNAWTVHNQRKSDMNNLHLYKFIIDLSYLQYFSFLYLL